MSIGAKRTCPSCSSRFYDLERNPAVCPKCGHSFDPEVAQAKRRGRKKTVVTASEPVRKKKQLSNEMAEMENSPEFEDIEDMKEIDDIGEVEEVDGDIDGIEEYEEPETLDEESEEAIIDELEVEDETLIDSLEDELEHDLEHELEEELEEEEEEDDEDEDELDKKNKRSSKPKPATARDDHRHKRPNQRK